MEKVNNKTLNDVMCIYKIVNRKNGRVYIGSTSRFKRRINKHIDELNRNEHINTDLQKDWNINGGDSFFYEIVEHIETKELLKFKEKHHIEEYRKLNGVYNKSDPIEEFHLSRKEERDRGKNKEGVIYENTKVSILRYMDSNFTNLISAMLKHKNEKIYFNKEKIDKWIIDHIEDEKIKK